LPDLRIDLGPPATPASPAPEVSQPLVVPPHYGGRLNHMNNVLPVRPHARDQYPEETIPVGQSWPWTFVLEDGELLSQRNILESKILPAFQGGS